MVEIKFNIEEHLINQFFTQSKAEELSKQMNQVKSKDREFEKAFVKRIREHIEIEDKNKKNNTGSLYDMFNSSFFTMDMVLYYLDKREDDGVLDTLVNLMYSRFINESFFYLPQLCTLLTYKQHSSTIEDYLLDRCVNQMKFSLQVHWLVKSYFENTECSKISKFFDKLLQKIEETLVNGRRPTMSNYAKYKGGIQVRNSLIFQQSIDKEFRLKYFDLCVDFYQKLKDMCEKLKSFPKEGDRPNNRNSIMRDYLFVFNNTIETMRQENMKQCEDSDNTVVKNFYKGIILPFDDYFSTMDEYNSIILRIIPEQSFCFSTKARVPVKLCVECVRVNECFSWEELFVKEGSTSINSEIGKLGFNSTNETPYDQLEHCEQQEDVKDKEDVSEKGVKKEFKSARSLMEFMSEVKKEENTLQKYNNTHISAPFKQKEEDDLVVIEFNPDIINPFGKKWTDVCQDIRETSPFKNFQTYSIKTFIAKADDDLRQELMTMQLIKKFNEIFSNSEINLKIRPYEILITSSSSGLIEFIPNSNSIDGVKKKLPSNWNLNNFFRNFYADCFEEAQKNFAESLAAYSLLSYYIQIKDRHNGNILLDMKGNVIHIDFGFILGINPGNLNFESAPFKLTTEYVEILDGMDSPIFQYYKSLMLRGMIEAKKHVDSFVKIVDIMGRGKSILIFFLIYYRIKNALL